MRGELRNLFSLKQKNLFPNLLILDADENVAEIGYKKGILVINFWATWCAPCKKEMPSLNTLAQNMTHEDLQIITVASGRNSKEAIDTFFKDYNLINLSKYRDPKGKMAKNMG